MGDRCRTHQTRACETCDDTVAAAETVGRDAIHVKAHELAQVKAELDRLRAGIEALLADGPDTWQGYDSRDTGHTFLAESVLDFTADLRQLLGGHDVRDDLQREFGGGL